ncbi:hypothetical protein TI39_contig490g00013 [Zymoseptoria brevis]|uniref:Uncharacterized protein n=1 Tax=Zymoseptoria brevis TaxID=1047168 RepID=A0A0F4GMQ4_9PEZI|nr:hypothetical protein TI39_contig490g00013 [Zymoseptoria brevis]
MPSSQQLRDFYAEHEPTDGAAFQVYEASLEQNASARDLVAPPIPTDGFDVDNVLASFRHLSRAGGYEHTYELGIVTQDPNGFNHSVALLPSFPDMESTDTIWIIRRLQGRIYAPPLELWSALLPSPTRYQTRAAPPAMPSGSEPSAQTANSKKRLNEAGDSHGLTGFGTATESVPTFSPATTANPPTKTTAASSSTMPSTIAMPPPAASIAQTLVSVAAAQPVSTTAPGKINKSDLHVYPNPTAIGTLSNDDILSGKIHPRDFKLNLILHLALSNDNKALFNRINALYTSLGLSTRGESSITKRVSKAFEGRAKELDPRDENGVKIPIGELRAQFDQYRRENGARARGGDVGEYRFKGKPKGEWVAAGPPRRKGKKKVEVEVSDEGEEDEDAEVGEDEEEDEAPLGLVEEDGIDSGVDEDAEEDMTSVKKRRRLTRMKDEDDEED